MAEAPGGISRNPGPSGSEGLLATKLYLPRASPGFTPRPRLANQLDDGFARKLTLVCAPAGYGKTAMLADWCQRRGRPVGWLSLDAADNDPARYWRHVAATLDRVRPGVADRVAPLLGPPAPQAFDGVATALVNELVADPGELLLVLDDYHLIDAEAVHASMLFLFEHAPPELHVVIASRADPQLPLARMRARGELSEVRVNDLRFTDDEAAALLREALGADLRRDAVAALAARTEGWAAGLQLAALSLHGTTDVASFVAAFSGSQRYVLDYLTEEVLERQADTVREFLLETSMLERLSGPLCDAVTGRDDGQRMLEATEQSNLFLMPLDEVRGWWRYHHLFAELLRARLQQGRPERARELHRNAAAWHHEHGLVDHAVRHALAAGESVWAARLVEQHFDELFLSSEGATVQRWLKALPWDEVAWRPRLHMAQAALHVVGGRLTEIEGPLDEAERTLQKAPDEPFEPSVGWGASRLANLPAAIAVGRAYAAHLRGDGEATVRYASQALGELDASEWVLTGLAQTNLAMAEWVSGNVEKAEQAMAANVAQFKAAGHRDLTALRSSYLGRIQCALGRLDVALATYGEAREVAAPPGRPPSPAAGVADVGTAEVAYHRGELDAARRYVTEGIARCRQFVYTEILARGLVTLAWIKQADGDTAGALDAMAEAEQVTDPAVTDMLNPVPAERARLWLAQGDVARALQWTVDRGLSPDDEPSYPREAAHLVLARVLLAQGRARRATQLLGRLQASAAAQGRIGSIIEVQALLAVALVAGGDEDGAVAALVEALTLAYPQGYIRVFVDAGAPMAALVGRVIAGQPARLGEEDTVPMQYLARVARAFERHLSQNAPDATPVVGTRDLVTQLSDREREVLRLLAAGKQNREIAAELYLAINTVKKHVTHVLDKLGASNRTEATARARELGLLD